MTTLYFIYFCCEKVWVDIWYYVIQLLLVLVLYFCGVDEKSTTANSVSLSLQKFLCFVLCIVHVLYKMLFVSSL